VLKLNTKREYDFEYVETKKVLDKEGKQVYTKEGKEKEKKDVVAKFHFEFPFTEEQDYDSIRKIITRRVNDTTAIKDAEVTTGMAQQAQYTILRESLKSWSGIEDQNGNELKVIGKNNNIIVLHQKTVFEFIRHSYLYVEVEKAFHGLEVKN